MEQPLSTNCHGERLTSNKPEGAALVTIAGRWRIEEPPVGTMGLAIVGTMRGIGRT
jgi:hypothetical protein